MLYGKTDQLATQPPWQGGCEMIRRVTFRRIRFADPPKRFEAGHPDFAGAVGLAAAIDYPDSLDRDALARHEQDLLA